MAKRVLIYTILFVLLFSACGNDSLPDGVYCPVNGLPSLADFSSSNYETFAQHFSTVKSAIYKYNGTENHVSPDDPRLISLLNFLAFSYKQGLTAWRQGYVPEDEIASYLTTKEPMLEITFHSNNISEATSQIIICGDSYLVIKNTETDGQRCERCWPYGELIMEKITSGEADISMISYEGWGTNYWIDLLEYAGFEPQDM